MHKHRAVVPGPVRTIDVVPYGSGRTSADRTVRASDRDREGVVALLGEHTGAGRLSLPEFEERVSSAYAAQTLADLDGLLVDLPAPVRAPDRAARAEVSRHAGMSAWLATAVICLAIWGLTSLGTGTWLYFWPMWVIGPWGAVILSRLVAGRGCARGIR